MLRVALTGGIGSGKSAAAKVLRELGAEVSQSDEVARSMMQAGQPLFQDIEAYFGPSVVLLDGQLDRPLLARLAFEQGRLEELNALVHPAVIDEQVRWLDAVEKRKPNAVAVIESALVLETQHVAENGSGVPWRTRFDRIVVVSAEQGIRQQRYAERLAAAGHRSRDQAISDFQRRLAAQWNDAEREALADYVVRNDGTLQDLRQAVSEMYSSLRQEVADRQDEAM